ncbi:MAG: hypothetical protein Q4F97_08780 [Bacteroidales bacterium]|nr:hypothetical protein [Bacteroidales bacterium]
MAYDKDEHLLIVQNNESARITSEIQLNKIDDDTLELDIKCCNVFFNKRQAVVCGIKLPPKTKCLKIKGKQLLLSELRAVEDIVKLDPKVIDPSIIFNPTYFPFKGKIRCYKHKNLQDLIP